MEVLGTKVVVMVILAVVSFALGSVSPSSEHHHFDHFNHCKDHFLKIPCYHHDHDDHHNQRLLTGLAAVGLRRLLGLTADKAKRGQVLRRILIDNDRDDDGKLCR